MTRDEIPRALLSALDDALAGPLRRYRPLRVFLFGSRAKGTADRRSDFDIGVDAGRPLSARDLTELRVEDRNRTSHLYDAVMAEEVFARLAGYHALMSAAARRL